MTIHEIRLRKQELGYTNAQLAQLSGVPLGTVMKVLSGATKSPRRETLLALEKALSPYRHPSQGAGYDMLLPDHPAYDHESHAGAANAALVRESSMKYNTSRRTKREDTEHGVSVDSAQNAAKYGWSLSFPQGYEDVTGYMWECWHFRYIGEEACRFQKKWFSDIQQFMIEFLDAWNTIQ